MGGGQLAFIPHSGQTPQAHPAATADLVDGSREMETAGHNGEGRGEGGAAEGEWWFVRSGGFGGALYAVACGSVFEGIVRKYLLGECPYYSAGRKGAGRGEGGGTSTCCITYP